MFLIIIFLFYSKLYDKDFYFYNHYFVFYSFTVLVLQYYVKLKFLIWKEDYKTISADTYTYCNDYFDTTDQNFFLYLHQEEITRICRPTSTILVSPSGTKFRR